jgi:pimeloyl-ACP methyl ester carboxylesterase
MNEVTLAFGREANLVGTLTLPRTHSGDTAYLLPNAGVIHRIGPHRFNVKLARRLAALGIPALRFDLAGVGDSTMPRSSPPYPERMIAAMREAMEVVEREAGVRRFCVVGICSGADNALAVAAAEPRVVGIALIDGYAYPTLWTPWHRYRRRLGHGPLAAVRDAIGRRIRLLGQRLDAGAVTADPSRRPHPPRSAYAAQMQELVDRGVRVLLVHTGSLLRRYSYARQLQDAFGAFAFAARVEVVFCPDVDHTVTTLAAQQQIFELLESWARGVATGSSRLDRAGAREAAVA